MAAVFEAVGRMHRWSHLFRMDSRSAAGFGSVRAKLRRIKARCAELRESSDAELKAVGEGAADEIEDIAVTVEVARRTLGFEMSDVQRCVRLCWCVSAHLPPTQHGGS